MHIIATEIMEYNRYFRENQTKIAWRQVQVCMKIIYLEDDIIQ